PHKNKEKDNKKEGRRNILDTRDIQKIHGHYSILPKHNRENYAECTIYIPTRYKIKYEKEMIVQIVPLNKHTRKDTVNTSTLSCFLLSTKTNKEAKSGNYNVLH
ncbi:6223_t:CDS:1, partial [Gigaspora margarita]